MNETAKDQRVYSRIPSRVTVVATQIEYPFTESAGIVAQSIDVAEGGISFISTQNYLPNAIVSLKVDMKGWRRHAKSVLSIIDDTLATAPLTAVVEVVWSKPLAEGEGYEIGAKFINIDQDDYNAFKKYLSEVRTSGK